MEREYLPGEARDRIKDLMKERGVNQTDLAKMAGCDRSTISRFLTGKIDKLSDDSIIAIAKGFHVATDFLLGISDKPDRTSFELEELGLSVNAGKALYTNPTNAMVVNALLECKSFSALAALIRQYMEGSNAMGYAAQNQVFSMMAAMVAGENTEAAREIKSHIVPVYEADTTHIRNMFDRVLNELRQDNRDKFKSAKTLTSEVMEKLLAQLPKNVMKTGATPEQMVGAIIGTAEAQDVFSREQLDGLRTGLLPLFQKPAEGAEDAGTDE